MSLKYTTFVKLGFNKNLSKLDLSSLLEKIEVGKVSYVEWKDHIFLDIDKPIFNKFTQKLPHTGSIVKVGKISLEKTYTPDTNMVDLFAKHIFQCIQNLKIDMNKQIKFSLNIQTNSKDTTAKIGSQLRSAIKKLAHDYQFKVKMLSSKRITMELSPYEYHKNNMNKRGIELNCFVIKSKIYFGFTLWVTNPFIDIEDDEKRPIRLFTHGLSFKMTRTLINIAKIPKNGWLLDPFAGTGTILQCGLRQSVNVAGIDNDPKCVRASKENLKDFCKNASIIKKKELKWIIYKYDSRQLNQIIKTEIDAVITEPYLGPFLKQLPDLEEGKETMKSLEKLYTKVLINCKKLLKKEGKVVIIFPSYNYSKDIILTPNISKIEKLSGLTSMKQSKYFNVFLPFDIGRKHNVISRKLVVFINSF